MLVHNGFHHWLWGILLYIQLSQCAVHTYTSALQHGAIWPMAGRNQYHTSQSVFGINPSDVASATKGSLVWSLKVSNSAFYSSPIISKDGTIYVGSSDWSMYAVDSTTRSLRWKYATGASIFGTAALSSVGSLYFGSYDGNLYALNATTGLLKWTFKCSDSIRSSPVLGKNGDIYVAAIDGNIYSISQYGTKQWKQQPPQSKKVLGNLAYYGDNASPYLIFVAYAKTNGYNGESLLQLNASSGNTLDAENNMNTASFALSSPSIDINSYDIYVATSAIQSFWNVRFSPPVASALSKQRGCCGTAQTTDCSQGGDTDHSCQIMGSSYTTPAVSSTSRWVFWGSSADGQSVGSSVGKSFFYAYDPLNYKILSAYPIGSAVQGQCAIDKSGVVYVGTISGDVVALQYSTNPTSSPTTVVSEKWRITLPNVAIYSSLTINADGTIIVVGSDGSLYAIGNSNSVGSLISAPVCANWSTNGKGLDNTLNAYDSPLDYPSLRCDTCPVGTHSTGTVCAPCEVGKFSSLTGQSECMQCSPGTAVSSFASTSCQICEVGKFATFTGQSVCSTCSPGKYAPNTAQTTCYNCLAGSSSSEGSSFCTQCSAGTYAATEGTGACQSCSTGFYSASGSSSCSGCPFGTSSSTDFSNCVSCPFGKYSDKTGSACLECKLGSIHTINRRSCAACPWPLFTSVEGNPVCDTFTIIPYRDANDLLAASISIIAIVCFLSFFFVWGLTVIETTSDDETHVSGNIVTRLGLGGLLLLPNAALLSTTIYILTKNFLTLSFFILLWISMFAPLFGFFKLVQDHHAIAGGVANEWVEAKSIRNKCFVFTKLLTTVFPWTLFGYGCYVSRILCVKCVWNVWFHKFTGSADHSTRDKFNCRFWNHCHKYALFLQYLPQLILVVINETHYPNNEMKLAGQWTLLGALTVFFLVLNIAICAYHLITNKGRLDAAVKLSFNSLDIVLLHFDPAVLDLYDDAPLEQGMVRGVVIFNGEGIEEVTHVEVLHKDALAQGRVTHEPLHEPGILNLGGLLTLTHELMFTPEQVPIAAFIPVGRATRIFECTHSVAQIPINGRFNDNVYTSVRDAAL